MDSFHDHQTTAEQHHATRLVCKIGFEINGYFPFNSKSIAKMTGILIKGQQAEEYEKPNVSLTQTCS